ncbi:MAG: response regulator [Candidatus Bathyarchaeota archaeon]|nr:response regulator [Candidatus Bathyarchaeota archaeon]
MNEPKRSILIVDDDRAILRVFTRLLEKKGYVVKAVETGKDALSEIDKTRFDAALIDVRLPDMKGTAILPVLRKTSSKTVRIVITGSPDLKRSRNETRVDMDAFLVKPVNPDILLGVLNEKLKTK